MIKSLIYFQLLGNKTHLNLTSWVDNVSKVKQSQEKKYMSRKNTAVTVIKKDLSKIFQFLILLAIIAWWHLPGINPWSLCAGRVTSDLVFLAFHSW